MRVRERALTVHSAARNFAALAVAVDLHLALIGTYLLAALLSGPEARVPTRPDMTIDFSPPAFPGPAGPRRPKGGSRMHTADRGIVKPVFTVPETIDSALSDFPALGQPGPTGVGEAGGIPGEGSPEWDENGGTGGPLTADADTGIFQAVEKPPIPVRIVKPDYPDAAKQSGLEGSVMVKVLVERDGRPSKAMVVVSTNEMFNERAEQAAMKWVFVPGMMTSGPVRVWTAIPFKFTLSR